MGMTRRNLRRLMEAQHMLRRTKSRLLQQMVMSSVQYSRLIM